MDTKAYIILAVIIVLACAVGAVLYMRAKGAKKPPAPAAMEPAAAAQQAAALLAALGGKDNIAALEHCTMRLRAEVKSYAAVDEAAAKAAGAASAVRPAKNTCLLVLGAHAPQLYAEIKKLL